MKKWFYIVLFVGWLLGLAGCSIPPDETIIFVGPESYITPLDQMIPDAWQSSFFSNFDSLPQGYYPPNIEGEYRISKKQFCTSNLGYDLSDSLDMYLRVVNQDNRLASVQFFEGGTVWTDTAFITGNDPWFSLYFKEKRALVSYGTTHTHRRFVLFTGRKSEEGIHDLYFGTVILGADNGDDPYVGAFIPGWYFIYKDQDGLSENSDWFSHEEDEDE